MGGMLLQVKTASAGVDFKDLIIAGGWIMIPLFILSIAAVYILVERFMTIKAAYTTSDNFLEDVKRLVKDGEVDQAKTMCEQVETPLARMIGKGVSRIGLPVKKIEASIENVGKIEVDKLEKNLSILGTIAGVGPMIGFLGTVIGMIGAFISIAEAGTADVVQMSGGIYEAMVTTAAGLIVGVVAYVSYNYLINKVQKIVQQMEHSAIECIELLEEPQS